MCIRDSNPAFLALASGALFVTGAYATTIASTNYMMLYVWQLSDAQLRFYPVGLAVAVFGAFAAVGHAPVSYTHLDVYKRQLFAWGGGLLVFFLANTVFLRPDATHKFGQLNPAGYWLYGLCGAIIMAVTVFISALGQHRRIAHLPATKPEPGTPRRAFAEIWESLRHPAALILLGASLIAISSTQMTFTISNLSLIHI